MKYNKPHIWCNDMNMLGSEEQVKARGIEHIKTCKMCAGLYGGYPDINQETELTLVHKYFSGGEPIEN